MKKIFLIIALFTVSNFYAQAIVPLEQQSLYSFPDSQGKYFKDVNGVLDKFFGTWRYESGTETLEISFYKRTEDNSNYKKDILYAYYFSYTQNGVIIFSDANPNSISYGRISPVNHNIIGLQYYEPDELIDKRKTKLYLTYIPNPGEQPQLRWKLDWYYLSDDLTPPKMPKDIILTKVN